MKTNRPELPVELPRSLTNEIAYYIEDGKEYVLLAKAFDLHFDGDIGDVRGNASIAKYEVRTVTRLGLSLSQFGIKRTTQKKNVLLWNVYADEFSHKFFLSSGQPTGYGCSAHYKSCLLANTAQEKGLVISKRLLDEAFEPIIQKILAVYRTAEAISSH